MNLREQPIRLERYLTRDYINQSQKMAEIEARINQKPAHPMAVVLDWVLVGILATWVLINY